MTEAAKRAAQVAAGALGATKGTASTSPEGEGQKEDGRTNTLGSLLGFPTFDPQVAKAAVIQGAVITALVIMFFVGLAMFVSRSIRIR